VRAVPVIENRERSVESCASQAFFVEELTGLAPQGQMRLRWKLAFRDAVEHSGTSAGGLLPLDALEQRPEVACSETVVSLALDHFEEEGPASRLW